MPCLAIKNIYIFNFDCVIGCHKCLPFRREIVSAFCRRLNSLRHAIIALSSLRGFLLLSYIHSGVDIFLQRYGIVEAFFL